MIVEEKKAKNFNCHHPDAAHCAGAKCMAWRWADPFNEGEQDLPASWRSTTHGYCGLAGRP